MPTRDRFHSVRNAADFLERIRNKEVAITYECVIYAACLGILQYRFIHPFVHTHRMQVPHTCPSICSNEHISVLEILKWRLRTHQQPQEHRPLQLMHWHLSVNTSAARLEFHIYTYITRLYINDNNYHSTTLNIKLHDIKQGWTLLCTTKALNYWATQTTNYAYILCIKHYSA